MFDSGQNPLLLPRPLPPSLTPPQPTPARRAKTKKSVFCVKASRAEGPRRLHTNTVYARLWGFSRPSNQTSLAAGDVWLEGRLKVQRWGVQGLRFRASLLPGVGARFVSSISSRTHSMGLAPIKLPAHPAGKKNQNHTLEKRA